MTVKRPEKKRKSYWFLPLLAVFILVFLMFVVLPTLNRPGSTALISAVTAGKTDEVRLLLERGMDVNMQDKLGVGTPLHWAAADNKNQTGTGSIARLLIKQGARVDARNRGGYTPLHWAARRGNIVVVKLLVEHRADVNARDNNGVTPLSMAKEKSQTEVVELLRRHGAK